MPTRKRTDGDRWREIAAAFFRYDETGDRYDCTRKAFAVASYGLCWALEKARVEDGLPWSGYGSPGHRAITAGGCGMFELPLGSRGHAALRGMYALLLAEVADDTHDTYTYEETTA